MMAIAGYILSSMEDMYIEDTGRKNSIWDGINPMSRIDETQDSKQILSDLKNFFVKAQINNFEQMESA
jgi:hypothetical protein